jgi:phosphate transport system permease protein
MDEHSNLTHRDRGARADTAFRWAALLAGATVLAILVLIVYSMVDQARPAFQESGWKFLTSTKWVPNDPDGPTGPKGPEFGALAFVYGTVVVSAIALFFAVPVSIGIALFTTELAGSRLRTAITTVMDLMAAVPSVVFGLWGVAVLAKGDNITKVYDWVADRVASIPGLRVIFGTGGTGRSFMTAGLILAVMITPIITSLTREVFNTVPRAEKDAALALGATRWEMIKGAVFPHSFGGIVGAVMLGLGRALGETIAVALTIGSSARIIGNLFKSGDAMPARIVNEFGESSGLHRSALVGLGVALFLITILVNSAARVIVARAEIRLKGVS